MGRQLPSSALSPSREAPILLPPAVPLSTACARKRAQDKAKGRKCLAYLKHSGSQPGVTLTSIGHLVVTPDGTMLHLGGGSKCGAKEPTLHTPHTHMYKCQQCPSSGPTLSENPGRSQHATSGIVRGHHWLLGQLWSSKKHAFQIAEVGRKHNGQSATRGDHLKVCALYLGTQLNRESVTGTAEEQHDREGVRTWAGESWGPTLRCTNRQEMHGPLMPTSEE